jgi:tellurite methyltransferase
MANGAEPKPPPCYPPAVNLPVPTPPDDLRQVFGDIDIYLFDQLLRGRLTPGMKVLDAGCGNGRNLDYLLRAGFEVFAVDRSPRRVETARRHGQDVCPGWSDANTAVAELAAMPFEDGTFDAVLCNAVLHLSDGPAGFRAALDGLWRVLAPGGLLWTRLASSIGIEHLLHPLGEQRFRLPDGSDRFLVDESELLEHTRRLGAELLDPIKTTNVQGRRCMTTWVLRRPDATS